MVMAVSIFYHPQTTYLMVIAGYESGHTSVSQVVSSTWQTLYTTQAHTQPILSLDVSSNKHFYVTSSADAIIAKHPIPVSKHAGQQSLRIRNDGRIFATAGWDSRVRVYSVNGMKELAVLKWHKEGCYTTAFADVPVITDGIDDRNPEGKELVKRIGTMTVQQERLLKAKTSHWLAAGSKDGKVSLWEIY
jgi:WD40 repeat protein